MKKFLITCMLVVCTSYWFLPFASISVQQDHIEPSYAKWGKFAMEKVKQKYNVTIIDYLHVGRKTLSPTQATETFKFWVRGKDQHEFGIYVSITFDPRSDAVQSIKYRQTTH